MPRGEGLEGRAEKEKQGDITLKELNELTRNLDFKIFEMQDQLYEDNPNMSLDERMGIQDQETHKLIEGLVEKLEQKKERFRQVFETEQGSKYFVTQQGESVRIKRTNGERYAQGDLQPPTRKIFFIDQNEFDRLPDKRAEKLRDVKIRQAEYQEGAYPVELNIDGFGWEIVFEEGEDPNGERYLVMKGSRPADHEIDKSSDQLVGGFHMGHKITEIIK